MRSPPDSRTAATPIGDAAVILPLTLLPAEPARSPLQRRFVDEGINAHDVNAAVTELVTVAPAQAQGPRRRRCGHIYAVPRGKGARGRARGSAHASRSYSMTSMTTMTTTTPTLISRMPQPAYVVPGAMEALLALGKAIGSTALPETTRELVNLRASQINGCGVCLVQHPRSARKLGVDDDKLPAIAG
jgi:AhpD family alkylhydroperoxidase